MMSARPGVRNGLLWYAPRLAHGSCRAAWRRDIHCSELLQAAKGKPPRPAPRNITPPQPPSYKPGTRPSPGASSGAPKPGERQTLDALFAQRRLPLVGSALAAGVLGLYLSYLAVVFFKTPCPDHDHGATPLSPPPAPSADGTFAEPAVPTGRPPALNRASAAAFDTSLDLPEWLMGITRLRRRLAATARGHVLEVAVGTGRNLAFYDWDDVADLDPGRRRLRQLEKSRLLPREEERGGGGGAAGVSPEMTSFTGVDISGDVLETARRKMRDAVPGASKTIKKRLRRAWGTGPEDELGRVEILNANGGRLRLLKSDAQAPLPPPPATVSSAPAFSASPPSNLDPSSSATAAEKYDTILQTFGLCSVSRPADLLANLAAAVQPGTGRILLLEHGRGRWGAVDGLLDRYAGRHFERFGCWWNRDIEAIVREAAGAVPGLEVVHIRRPGLLQAGTTLLIELRVNPGAQAPRDG